MRGLIENQSLHKRKSQGPWSTLSYKCLVFAYVTLRRWTIHSLSARGNHRSTTNNRRRMRPKRGRHNTRVEKMSGTAKRKLRKQQKKGVKNPKRVSVSVYIRDWLSRLIESSEFWHETKLGLYVVKNVRKPTKVMLQILGLETEPHLKLIPGNCLIKSLTLMGSSSSSSWVQTSGTRWTPSNSSHTLASAGFF